MLRLMQVWRTSTASDRLRALDLHRMTKIIEVNMRVRSSSPANKLRVWPSVPSLGRGSVVGSVRFS